MRFFREKIESLVNGWNKRPLTEGDFHRLCRRHRITVDEMPLRVSGFYYCVMGRHFIAIDSKLPPTQKLFVMFHEFAHYLMHAPNTNETASYHGVGRRTRKEEEADLFALVALIPIDMLRDGSVDGLVEDGFERDMVERRFAIFEKHGI